MANFCEKTLLLRYVERRISIGKPFIGPNFMRNISKKRIYLQIKKQKYFTKKDNLLVGKGIFRLFVRISMFFSLKKCSFSNNFMLIFSEHLNADINAGMRQLCVFWSHHFTGKPVFFVKKMFFFVKKHRNSNVFFAKIQQFLHHRHHVSVTKRSFV